MTTNIQPVEIAGEHWITIKMDGCDMEPRGPFSTTEAAEAAATKFGAILSRGAAPAGEDRRTAAGKETTLMRRSTMDDVVNLPISLESDLGRELIVDCVRFAEGILTEQQVRKKFRFDAGAWEALGSNEELIEKIEAEKLRRMRDGSTKREKAQLLVVKAPDVVAAIMNDDSANARHRIDSAKVLNDFAAPLAGAGTAGGEFFRNYYKSRGGSGWQAGRRTLPQAARD